MRSLAPKKKRHAVIHRKSAERRLAESGRVKAEDGASWHMEHCYEMRRLYNESGEQLLPLAKHILEHLTNKEYRGIIRLTPVDCQYAIWKYVKWLLAQDYYDAAAILLWGPELFTPEPDCTQKVWKALRSHNKNLIQGGGSLSKSYSGAVYYSLWWLEDPEYTALKVMSVTKEHAKRNIFAHIKNLLSTTIVPVPNLDVQAESVRVNKDDKQGIHLVTIPMGDDGKGRLRGFHPNPRPGNAHPKFGRLSRIALALDEAEEIPAGVWEDLNNILLTDTKTSSNLKIFAATNPRNRQSKFAEYAEPKGGWSSVDIDVDHSWESRLGWHVTRLDGALCENVVQKRVVFEGLQTWEGFENLLKLGENHPEYYTMARGWFPEASASSVIITDRLFERSKGFFHWSGPTISAGGVDVAFDGDDDVIFTAVRTGNAIGWTDTQGQFHKFTNERRCVQLEQQFMLPKDETITLSKTIRRTCVGQSIKAPWLTVDRTGNGTGVHDACCGLIGPEVLGVMFSWAATDQRILDDDTMVANEVYHDIISEMAFTVKRFMETDLFKMNPAINWNELEKQTVTRKYSQVGRGFLRIEDKKTFKKRLKGKSPDRFDSLILAVHGVRMNTGLSAPQVKAPAKPTNQREAEVHGIVHDLDFIDFSDGR